MSSKLVKMTSIEVDMGVDLGCKRPIPLPSFRIAEKGEGMAQIDVPFNREETIQDRACYFET
jgi:hypothetical protein